MEPQQKSNQTLGRPLTPYQGAVASAKKYGFNSYEEYLESNHWRELKAKLGMYACCCCSTSRYLLAHHIRYRDLVDVQVTDLVTMCSRCHDIFHTGCRKHRINYVGVEADQIASLVTQFKSEYWFEKRERRLVERAERKARTGSSKKPTQQKIRKHLKLALKGGINPQKVHEFCEWLKAEFPLP